ncbi:MAG: chromosomal replication initiator protein DnaA [Candidatus Paceibacterota bacterium]
MAEKTILDKNKLWEQVLVEIELSTSKANFNTWFADTTILRREEGTIYIGVPNEFVRTWLIEKYDKKIKSLIRELTSDVQRVKYEVGNTKNSKTVDSNNDSVVKLQKNSSSEEGQLLLTESVDKNNNLNPRYSFESFVVGSFNELAHAASQAVVKQPGSAYNPLFIYGKTGFGKTHLIQAIGNHFIQNSDKKAFYLTSEKFAVDYINSVKNNKVNQFKEKYRQYDCLIMDDIQFLSKKEKTQEELFHLFNTLFDNNKQIIFSSDMHPNYLKDMEDRLKSRFNAGMIVDISPPEHESRVAILKKKAKEKDISLSEDVLDYVANSIKRNIRELEGALNAIAIQSELSGGNLTLVDIKRLIKDNVSSQKVVNIEDIIQTVSNFYNIEEEKIYSKTRKREIVKPRQVVMFILREDFSFAYPAIGEKIGGRDHTTVIHSYKKIKEELKTDGDLVSELNQIRSLL